MYKQQLKQEICNLVSEGKINFDHYQNLMEKFKIIKEEDLKLLMEGDTPTSRKTVFSILGILPGTGNPIIWALYRTIRGSFDECTEKCGTYKINNKDRQRCMISCRQDYKKKMGELKQKAAKMKKK